MYYNPVLPTSIPTNPDFVILGDDLGIVTLEVKDFRSDTIREVNLNNFLIRTTDGVISVKNPFLQAKGYAETMEDVLEGSPQLVNHEGIYRGQLKFPYGYAVIFPNLSRRDSTVLQLGRVIPSNCLFLKEDTQYTSEHFSEREFLRKLRRTRRASFEFELSDEDINTIRGVLFPEIRIEGFSSYISGDETIKTLDAKQEQYAKSLRQGHQLIRGVAGSGKTIILIARAVYLKRMHPDWRILVVAFNRSLIKWLQNSLNERLSFSGIDVFGFHQLCRSLLISRGLWDEISDLETDKDDFWDVIVPESVLSKMENGNIRTPRYEAILVDESQDFGVSWFKVLLQLLNERTNELLMVMDQAQKIYQRGFTWRSVGIQVVGRSKILKVSYRTTYEIAKFAYDFIKSDDILFGEFEGEGELYINPENTVRHGVQPKIIRSDSFNEECERIRSLILEFIRSGYKKSDIFILSRFRRPCREINGFLKARGIPSGFITDFANWNPRNDSVNSFTMHSSKGLENKIVIICDASRTPDLNSENISEERRVLYVAMTRARDFLIISYNGNGSQFIREMEESGA